MTARDWTPEPHPDPAVRPSQDCYWKALRLQAEATFAAMVTAALYARQEVSAGAIAEERALAVINLAAAAYTVGIAAQTYGEALAAHAQRQAAGGAR